MAAAAAASSIEPNSSRQTGEKQLGDTVSAAKSTLKQKFNEGSSRQEGEFAKPRGSSSQEQPANFAKEDRRETEGKQPRKKFTKGKGGRRETRGKQTLSRKRNLRRRLPMETKGRQRGDKRGGLN